MNWTYRFHPSMYELGENEKFYSDMEARGWRLVKRGGYLSRFRRVEPSQARYRVEVCTPPFPEDSALPEEQIAVFAGCGWEYIADHAGLHIFRAPAGSDAPEFYADPRQQAETLKKVRRDLLWGWAALVLMPLLCWGLPHLLGQDLGRWWGQTVRRSIQLPGYPGALLAAALLALYCLIGGTFRINWTYFRLKRGRPLDHAPRRRLFSAQRVYPALLGMIALCVLSMAVQAGLAERRDLPETADGPYLLFTDLDIDEERSRLWYGEGESCVTYAPGPAAEYWDVFEIVGEERQSWMYQDVYRLRLEALAIPLARALLADSVFARSPEEYSAVDVPGLDAAWVCGELEAVAVRGNLVAHLEFLQSGEGALDPLAALEALAERWGAGGG